MRPYNPEFKNPEQEQILYVKDRFLQEVENGIKTAEVRPESTIKIPQINEIVKFQSSSREVTVKVKSIEKYKNLSYFINHANLNSFGKGITRQNAEKIWRTLYPNYNGGSIIVINFELQKENV